MPSREKGAVGAVVALFNTIAQKGVYPKKYIPLWTMNRYRKPLHPLHHQRGKQWLIN